MLHQNMNLKNLKNLNDSWTLDIWSVVLHFKSRTKVKFQKALISIESMASTDTPKKLYEKITQSTGSISRCRLCNSVTDKKYSKNLYRAQNRAILHNAESFYGEELPQNDSLLHLICAPSERRLNNAVKFKKIVEETQRVLRGDVREKRCINISPSIQKPPAKVRSTSSTGSSRRRSIDFSSGKQTQHKKTDSHAAVRPLHVSTFLCCHFYDNELKHLSILNI